MYSLHFVLFKIPDCDGTFTHRLVEVANKLATSDYTWPASFLPISNLKIDQICIGPGFAAFLLEDGRVCRIKLYASSEKPSVELKQESAIRKNSGSARTTDGSEGQGPGTDPGNPRPSKVRRIAVMQASTRGRRGVIVGSRPLIPATAVPEDLIAQAQVVLQGKSRDTIIRELQRTSLDVNSAVNNLLTREEDDGDDYHDAESYLPEELVSLLDANLDHPSVIIEPESLYGEDVFGFGFRRKPEKDLAKAEKKDNSAKGVELRSGQAKVSFGNALEFWQENQSTPLRFVKIAAMQSTLLGVTKEGHLYNWDWSQPPLSLQEKPKEHSKCFDLGLNIEQITDVSSSLIRATVLTQSQKVASFVDDVLGPDIARSLDFPCVQVPEPVQCIRTSNLFSVATAVSGSAYWWGALPFKQRRSLWEKTKHKSKKHVTFDSSEVKIGSQVRLRASPLYNVGTLGFTVAGGQPQVGTLMESAWTLTETCRFKIQDSNDWLKNGSVSQEESSNRTEEKAKSSSVSSESLESKVFYAELRRRMKRSIRDDVQGSSSKEEAWNLKDVVFAHEGNQQPFTGTVIHVDGAYCAVVFPDKHEGEGEGKAEVRKSRLLRKDELQVVTADQPLRSPCSLQKTLKKIILPNSGNILDLTVDSSGIMVLSSGCDGAVTYTRVSLSGRVVQTADLKTNALAFNSSARDFCSLLNYGQDGIHVILDGYRCFYPVAHDGLGKTAQNVGLSSVSSLGIGFCPPSKATGLASKAGTALVAFCLKTPTLVEHILHCDVRLVKETLKSLEREENSSRQEREIVAARIDGNRNIFHACLSTAIPSTNKQNVDMEEKRVDTSSATLKALYNNALPVNRRTEDLNFQDIMGMANPTRRSLESVIESRNASSLGSSLDSFSSPAHDSHYDIYGGENNSKDGFEIPDIPLPPTPTPVSDPKQRQKSAMEILKFLCNDSYMTSFLMELLSEPDSCGLTPFMYAVQNRLYSCAMELFETIRRLARATSQYKEALMSMLCPPGTPPDNSPLFLLAYNDTCSFTWTGDEHINQDIFECKTCGLVGTLCCCTECANVCHKGHDCKLKRTSPTAYCDCWEKCKCRSLIAGNQAVRLALLNKILSETDLVMKPNSKGEHILLYLVRTVGRQASEQKAYRPSKSKAQKSDSVTDMPEHDLDPPKFARLALERLLSDWTGVKSMLMMGSNEDKRRNVLMSPEEFIVNSQDGSVFLDRFAYTLISKCPQDMLDILLNTLIDQMTKADSSIGRDEELVCGRFVRSVVRIYVSYICTTSTNTSAPAKKKSLLHGVIRVFTTLINLAIVELAEAVCGLFAPIQFGILKPFNRFNIWTNSVHINEVLDRSLAIDPLPLKEKMELEPHVEQVSGEIQEPSKGNNNSEDEESDDSDYDEFGSDVEKENNAIGSGSNLTRRVGRVIQRGSARTGTEGGSNENNNNNNNNNGSGREPSNEGQEENLSSTEGRDRDGEDEYYSDQDESNASMGEQILDESGDVDMDGDGGDGDGASDHPSDSDIDNEDDSAVDNEGDSISTPQRNRHPSESASGFILSAPQSSTNWSSSSRSERRGRVGGGATRVGDLRSHGQEAGPTSVVTANLLARGIGVMIRQLIELLNLAFSYREQAPSFSRVLPVTVELSNKLKDLCDAKLEPLWTWSSTLMDYLEAKSQFSSTLTELADFSKARSYNGPTEILPPVTSTTTLDPRSLVKRVMMAATTEPESASCTQARQDFVRYVNSLLRSHTSEHADSIPTVHLEQFKDLAYILDALMLYLKAEVLWTKDICDEFEPIGDLDLSSCASRYDSRDESMEQDSLNFSITVGDEGLDQNLCSQFFKRSNSIIFPGYVESDEPFYAVGSDSIPMAKRPQMLEPKVSKRELFGVMSNPRFFKMQLDALRNTGRGSGTLISVSKCGGWYATQMYERKGAEIEAGAMGDLEECVRGVVDQLVDCTSAAVPKQPRRQRSKSVIVHASSLISESQKTSQTCVPSVAEAKDSKKEIKSQVESKSTECGSGLASYTFEKVVNRWPVVLVSFARIFADDVANEQNSNFVELAGFPVKEARFRKEMEKLRSSQKKDLVLEVDRERHVIIQQTVKQLNQFYIRRSMPGVNAPITVHKVKVTFRDEPGEGSGVARSFYAAIAEAFLDPDRLPNLAQCQGNVQVSNKSQHQLLNRIHNRNRERDEARRRSRRDSAAFAYVASPETLARSTFSTRRYPLNVNAAPFESSTAERSSADADKFNLGDRLYPRILKHRPNLASRITGMLMELPPHQIMMLLANDESLKAYVEEAVDLISRNALSSEDAINFHAAPDRRPRLPVAPPPSRSVSTPMLHGTDVSKGPVLDPDELIDNAPLFFQCSSNGFYAPFQGKASPERLNAFRNIGRLIGLCLLQGEILPLPLCRHVFKFILNRPITWFDLAFYDADLFDTFSDVVRERTVDSLDLSFSIDLTQEEGGGHVELKSGGSDLPVTNENVTEYLCLYVRTKLIVLQRKALEQIRDGVLDVLPSTALKNLTSEDVRLLLNGSNDVNIGVMQSFTSFADESNAPGEQLARFKKWFWNIAQDLTPQQKQDLIYFWTGSPGLPSSEEGFQPRPSIMIRPADDHHLPTANTCISRLYLPLYSSKSLLKQKLVLAIKARNFGFV